MLREQHVGVQSVRSAEARSLERTVEPVYLQVSSPADGTFDYFVPQTELASVQSYMLRVAADRRAELARKLAMTPAFDPALGAELAAFYVPEATQQTIVSCLGKSQNAHLVVIHDRAS